MKVLALDYGSARTGVAVSDPTGTVARPVTIVERAGSDAGFARLLDVIAAEEPELVVVGMPLTLRGEHGEQARETAAFVDRLRAAAELPVETYDERFTRCCRRRRCPCCRAPAVGLPRTAGAVSAPEAAAGRLRRRLADAARSRVGVIVLVVVAILRRRGRRARRGAPQVGRSAAAPAAAARFASSFPKASRAPRWQSASALSRRSPVARATAPSG